MTDEVRVRFCPSPTGVPHVGLIRTALFNWAFARHHGGKFIFRIEDTDAARDSQESYEQLLEAMRWLGLDWDEGVEVGGPHGPYRQSERSEIYQQVIAKLVESGLAYESFSSAEEITERHKAAGRDPQLGYDNFDRDLTDAQKAEYVAAGRLPVIRLRMPDEDITFTDLVRGEITFKAGSVPDFVIVRGNGQPLYTLVNPLDDALMGITHVLRGEDLLSSTPRQIALYRALKQIGIGDGAPHFGHLPYVMGQGNKKLSKRDPESNLFLYRERGFIKEGLINYLALLGWAIGPDRDVFSIPEFVGAFDIADVNQNPARFDVKKAEAINAAQIRLLPLADLLQYLPEYLEDVLPSTDYDELPVDLRTRLTLAAPLVQTRMQVLSQARDLLRFLFVSGAELEYDPAALKGLGERVHDVLDAAKKALEPIADDYFTAAKTQEALQAALIDGLQIKPRFAFGPVRTAMSGRKVSPPLFESLEILGKVESLDRLDRFAEFLKQN